MSKKTGGGEFRNRAARRFNDLQKADLMSEEEVYSILTEDIDTILGQITRHRNHEGGASYPQYINNIFANLSSARFFYEYVHAHVKNKHGKMSTDLDKDAILSLKQILADAYRQSTAKNMYQNQALEYQDRNEMLTKAFIRMDQQNYKLTKKLHLDDNAKARRRELAILVFNRNPALTVKSVARIFNHSTLNEKKKIKLLMRMYHKSAKPKLSDRFIEMVGGALTIESNSSDFVTMLYDFVAAKKRRKRAPYVRAYAEAFKRNKTYNFRLRGDFWKHNKPIIKELIEIDIGYKKAFKPLKPKNNDKKPVKKDKKKDATPLKNGYAKPWETAE